MKQINLIPHVHWDREWYFTSIEAKVLLFHHLNEVLDFLPDTPDDYVYMLDGQTALLEDFLTCSPEREQQVSALVQQGKLVIGPWYTQTDALQVTGESITRNLLYGGLDAKKYGPKMNIGYLPDTFGHNEQMPMIYQGFRIDSSVFWRGISKQNIYDTKFNWQAKDGSQVFVQTLPLSYAAGRYLPTEEGQLQKRLELLIQAMSRINPSDDNLIIPCGHDQMPIQKNLPKLVDVANQFFDDYQFKLNNLEKVCQENAKGSHPTYTGEFIDGYKSRIHRSIYSTRMDLKIKNTQLENYLTKIVEPILSMNYLLGIPYPQKLLENAWKLLLKNHAHDSMGNCCSDKTNQAISNRYDRSKEIAENLVKYSIISLSNRQDSQGNKLFIYNTLPYRREEIVKVKLVSKWEKFDLINEKGAKIPYDIIQCVEVDPSVMQRELKRVDEFGEKITYYQYEVAFSYEFQGWGFETLRIEESHDSKAVKMVNSESSASLEDNFYRIYLNDNGSFNVYCKKTGKDYLNLGTFQDGEDVGDSYDYSPAEKERIIDSFTLKESTVRKYNYFSELIFKVETFLPENYQERCAVTPKVKAVEIIEKITLKNNGLIEMEVTVDNQVEDHRMRMLFPTDIQSDDNYISEAFGTINRKNQMMDNWQEEGWEERPDNIYPMIDGALLKDGHRLFGFITNSGREYEVLPEHKTFAYTLFRSIGTLGKADIVRRPGRLSGTDLATPDHQVKKKISHSFALYLDGTEENYYSKVQEYLAPIFSMNNFEVQEFRMNPSEKRCPNHYNWDIFTSKELISAIKKSEEEDALIVRLVNPTSHNRNVSFARDIEEIQECYLDEVPKDSTSFEIVSNQVKTYKISVVRTECFFQLSEK